MKVTKIIKILLVLGVIYTVFYLVFEPDNHRSVKDITGFYLLGAKEENGMVILLIRNVGSSVITYRDVEVRTTAPCDPVDTFHIKPGGEEAVRFICPPGDVVRVSGRGFVYQKRLLKG